MPWNARTNKALRNAATAGDEAEVAELLATSGVRASSGVGITALRGAVKGGHGDVVDLLLSKGARVGAGDADGWTPLHHASQLGDAAVIEALLAAGADAGATTPEGWTPLHVAARAGNADAIAALLDRGANQMARDADGNTPYALALGAGRFDVVYALDPARAGYPFGADIGIGGARMLHSVTGREWIPGYDEVDGPFAPVAATGGGGKYEVGGEFTFPRFGAALWCASAVVAGLLVRYRAGGSKGRMRG